MKKNRGKTEKTPSPIDFSTIFRYNMDLCSRGGSGTLNLQSAIAGVMPRRGRKFVKLPPVSDVDAWVLRDGNLRTVSGRERSSTKQNLSGAVR